MRPTMKGRGFLLALGPLAHLLISDMAHIQTSKANYVSGGNAANLVNGPGRLLAVLAMSNSGAVETIILYDGLTEGTDILLKLSLAAERSVQIIWPKGLEPTFGAGLTVFTPDDVCIHCTTLAL